MRMEHKLLMVGLIHSLTPTRPQIFNFEGNCRCKNCGKATFKSDVCDLRCLSQWKARQKLGDI